MDSDAGGNAPLKIRIGFVVDLAARLHEYGTAAPRLEDVINLVSARLGLACNVLSTPTSIVMSFSDPAQEDGLAEVTQVVRLPPGEVNLKRLCQVDEIADQVIDGRLDLAAGRRRLREFGRSTRSDALPILDGGELWDLGRKHRRAPACRLGRRRDGGADRRRDRRRASSFEEPARTSRPPTKHCRRCWRH